MRCTGPVCLGSRTVWVWTDLKRSFVRWVTGSRLHSGKLLAPPSSVTGFRGSSPGKLLAPPCCDRIQGEFAGETPRTALLWPDSGGVRRGNSPHRPAVTGFRESSPGKLLIPPCCDRIQGEFAGETPRTALLWPDSGGVRRGNSPHRPAVTGFRESSPGKLLTPPCCDRVQGEFAGETPRTALLWPGSGGVRRGNSSHPPAVTGFRRSSPGKLLAPPCCDRVQGEFAGETPRAALLWPGSGGVHHSSSRMSLSHSPRSLSRSPTREWRALPNAYIKYALAVWPQGTASYLYQESCFLEAFMTWKYVWVSSFVVYKCLCVLHVHFYVFVSLKKIELIVGM